MVLNAVLQGLENDGFAFYIEGRFDSRQGVECMQMPDSFTFVTVP